MEAIEDFHQRCDCPPRIPSRRRRSYPAALAALARLGQDDLCGHQNIRPSDIRCCCVCVCVRKQRQQEKGIRKCYIYINKTATTRTGILSRVCWRFLVLFCFVSLTWLALLPTIPIHPSCTNRVRRRRFPINAPTAEPEVPQALRSGVANSTNRFP